MFSLRDAAKITNKMSLIFEVRKTVCSHKIGDGAGTTVIFFNNVTSYGIARNENKNSTTSKVLKGKFMIFILNINNYRTRVFRFVRHTTNILPFVGSRFSVIFSHNFSD